MTELSRPLRILLFCNRPKETDDASTILEHIDAFSKHSGMRFIFGLLLLAYLIKDIKSVRCLIVHYSISFLSDRYVSRTTRKEFENFPGSKLPSSKMSIAE